MKTLQTVQNEFANKHGFETWRAFTVNLTKTGATLLTREVAHNEAAELYADQFRNEWIDVQERLPENGEQVIGYFPDGDGSGKIVSTAITFNQQILHSDFPNSTAGHFHATKWQPLPSPPTKP